MSAEARLPKRGGLAQFFVGHREVGWMAVLAVLAWGWVSFRSLPQQEDPSIPERRALLVTHFPGADARKVEELVTKKIEEKIDELDSLEELKSVSRGGVSVINVLQRSARQAHIEQQWDKLRAKLAEVDLPEGCQAPFLDTEFGNTVTLLFGITSPPEHEAQTEARARVLRAKLAEWRANTGAHQRVAVFAIYPSGVDPKHRAEVLEAFVNHVQAQGVARDLHQDQGSTHILAEFAATTNRAGVESALRQFVRARLGSESDVHPDFSGGLLVWEDEDPRDALRQAGLLRHNYRELEQVAELLKDELKQVPSVGRVQKLATPQETVYLLFSVASVNGYRLAATEVLDAIAARNAVIPGGTFSSEGRNFPVRVSGEFTTEADMPGMIVGVVQPSAGSDGTPAARSMPVYLRDLFEVRRGYADPIPFRCEVLARPAPDQPLEPRRSTILAVEMKDGGIIGNFNADVSRVVEELRPRLPDGVEILRLSDQPASVVKRLHQFMKCFAEAVIVVVLVALLLMEWRSALVVAAAIPLTIAMTLGGMALLHVPLHQISIAGLIIALGMLVDDPVVASDAINRELAHGHPRALAAWLGPWRLRRAILFATLINIVAFLPLALLPDDKGAFIIALPIVVSLALVSSRIVSMTFVPFFGYYLLRGQKGLEAGGEVRGFPVFAAVDGALKRVLPRYRELLVNGLRRPGRVVAVAAALLGLSFLLTPFFGSQFFPPAERNQLLIDVQLPESASVNQTRQVCHEIAALLQTHRKISSAGTFIGGTAPRFYYNVVPGEPATHLAQVLVNTRRDTDVPPLLVKLRAELDRDIAGARCAVKQLEQGPPVETPIQIRLTGPDLDTLRERAEVTTEILRTNGGYKVHDDLGRRIPTLLIAMDQHRANLLAINNVQVGQLAQAAFAGLPVTELREGDHLIPVLARLRVEDRNEADRIRTMYVKSPTGSLVPVENFATVTNQMEYAVIPHYNKLRTVTVKSFSAAHELPSTVLKRARAALRELPLPPGYKLEIAGEDKELRQSRGDMARVMAISLSLIALAMVLQFNSVSKSLVVLLTVPLGLIGAFLGLALTGSPLGFMALLGIVSLAGVIVSHIIVLSDFIEEARAKGLPLKDALVQAGLVRLRPVLVTVLATVGGLIPLALTGGELWRPLTAVHIFGLLLATLLTLLVLPVLYHVFCAKLKWIK
jgi:multidrug efflux pump subunit AcrB